MPPQASFFKARRLFAFVTIPTLLFVCSIYYLQSRDGCSSPVPWEDVIEYKSRTILPLVSKDIVVRSVYFDDRSRSGHSNASVFMVEARRYIVDDYLIMGCQVGDHFGAYIQSRTLELIRVFVHWKHNYVTHDLLMVDCFDLPVKNGSRAFLLVKRTSSAGSHRGRQAVYRVESERPLFIPAPRISRGDDIKLLVCVATARYTVDDHRLDLNGMIYHWLKYQRTIGVDHVHIIAHPSFMRVGTLQNDVMRKAILEQFISMEFWEPWLNETDSYHGHSQMLAYQDCTYKFRGTYDYIVMCDTDDFFVPRISNEPKFQYYIRNWCHYGACRFHWIERYPDCGFDQDKSLKDGNVTAALKSNTAKRLSDNKSLYRSSIVLDVGIHMPMESMSGYSIIHVPNDVAYFAHVRPARLPEDTC